MDHFRKQNLEFESPEIERAFGTQLTEKNVKDAHIRRLIRFKDGNQPFPDMEFVNLEDLILKAHDAGCISFINPKAEAAFGKPLNAKTVVEAFWRRAAYFSGVKPPTFKCGIIEWFTYGWEKLGEMADDPEPITV